MIIINCKYRCLTAGDSQDPSTPKSFINVSKTWTLDFRPEAVEVTERGDRNAVRAGFVSGLFKAIREGTLHSFLIESNFDPGGGGEGVLSNSSAGNSLPDTEERPGHVLMRPAFLAPLPQNEILRNPDSFKTSLFREEMEGPWLTRRRWRCGIGELLRNTLSYIFFSF